MSSEPFSPIVFVDTIIVGQSIEKEGYRTIRPQGSPNWLVIFTLDGQGHIRAGEQEFITKKGDLTIFNQSAAHDYGTDSTWSQLFAHFVPRDYWTPLLEFDDVLPGVMNVNMQNIKLVHTVFDRMLEIWKPRGPLSVIRAMHSMQYILILGQLQRAADNRARGLRKSPHTEEWIDGVIQKVRKDLRPGASILEMAQSVGLSESRFAHRFVEETGLSPREYFERMRIQEACTLLRTSANTIKAISQQVGYASPYYFSLRFRHYLGESPSEFRSRGMRVGE